MAEERPFDPELTHTLVRICEALAALPSERVWEAAQRSEVVVSRATRATQGLEHVPFKQVFAEPAALDQAITAHAPEVQAAAIALLAEIDPEAAAGFLAELLQCDLSDYGVGSIEAGVGRAIGHVFQQLTPRLPAELLADLWLSVRLRMSAVPVDAVRAIPLTRIARAAQESGSFDVDADRLLQIHEGFADGDAVLALLDEIATTGHFALITRAIRRLGELRHAASIATLVRFLNGADPRYHTWATNALLEIGTPEALAPVAHLLDAGEALDAADARLPAAVEAAIRLDPVSSFDRFEPSFTATSLATPRGLRVARAVLSADHALLVQDPRWLALGVKFLADERLAARDMLAKYDEAALDEALRRAGANAARGAPADAVKPRERVMAEITLRFLDASVHLACRELDGRERLGEALELTVDAFSVDPVEGAAVFGDGRGAARSWRDAGSGGLRTKRRRRAPARGMVPRRISSIRPVLGMPQRVSRERDWRRRRGCWRRQPRLRGRTDQACCFYAFARRSVSRLGHLA